MSLSLYLDSTRPDSVIAIVSCRVTMSCLALSHTAFALRALGPRLDVDSRLSPSWERKNESSAWREVQRHIRGEVGVRKTRTAVKVDDGETQEHEARYRPVDGWFVGTLMSA